MVKHFTTLIPVLLVVTSTLAIPQAAKADAMPEPLDFAALETLETLDTDSMAALNGRDILTNVQSIQELKATVSDSAFNADTIISGAITIEQNAFEHFEGVGMFNMFTGNNNAVDSAVGISVYLTE